MRRAALVVLACIACDRSDPPIAPQRGESSEQIDRLRTDNEKELSDLRGKWLAAEGALLEMRRELAAATRNAETAREQQRGEAALLESLIAENRQALDAIKNAPAAPTVRSEPLTERVLRAYEELACAARRGAFESAPLVRSRWGFATHEEWALAWIEVARAPGFEAAAADRIARLCP